jgi:hypothetical protein
MLVALLAGGIAFTGHSSKAATRLAVNHSPEPFSNWALSFSEDLFVPVGLWIAFEHPALAMTIAAVVVGVFLWLSPKVLRLMKLSWVALRSRLWSWFGSRTAFPGPAMPPDSMLSGGSRDIIAQLPFEPIPDRSARKLRSALNAGGVRAGIHCAATRSIGGLKNSTGYLCVLPDQLVFVTRRMFRQRLFSIHATEVRDVDVRRGIFVDRLFVRTDGGEFAFDVFKAPGSEHAAIGGLKPAPR